MQVVIAAVVGELQKFGFNISALSSFAQMLQTGANYGLLHRPTTRVLAHACYVLERLQEFDAGGDVLIYDFSLPKEEIGGQRRPAKSELEIAEYVGSDYASPERLVELARSLKAEDIQSIKMVSDLIDEMDSREPDDRHWVVWQEENAWRYTSLLGGFEIDNLPSTSGILLAIGQIVRRTWSIDQRERRRLHLIERKAYIASIPGARGEMLRRAWEERGLDDES